MNNNLENSLSKNYINTDIYNDYNTPGNIQLSNNLDDEIVSKKICNINKIINNVNDLNNDNDNENRIIITDINNLHKYNKDIDNHTSIKSLSSTDYSNDMNNFDDDNDMKNMCKTVNEFSISSLNRKLKEIKMFNKNKKQHKQSLFFQRRRSSDNQNNYGNEKTKQLFNPRRSSELLNINDEKNNGVPIMIDPSKLISEHLTEMQMRIIGHTRSAILYERKEKVLGFPVTVISSFTTSSIMLDMTNDDTYTGIYYIKFISLALSIISFVLSISRDYLNYAKRYQSHDLSSKLYTTLLRSIEVRLIKNQLSKEERQDIFKDIVDQMSIIEQYETPIPYHIEKTVRKEIKKMDKN